MGDLEAARAYLSRARVHYALGDAARCRTQLDRGLEQALGTDSAVEARLLIEAARLSTWAWDAPAAVAAAHLALDGARRAEADLGWAEQVLGSALYLDADEACLEHFSAARVHARATGDEELRLEAAHATASALFAFARPRESVRLHETVRSVAAAAGRKGWEIQSAWAAARVRLLGFGDHAVLPEIAQLAREFGAGLSRAHILADLALGLADSGRPGEAKEALARMTEHATTPWTVGVCAVYRAEAEWALQQPARSLEEAERSLSSGPLSPPIERTARCARLWALFELGRPAGDSALRERSLPLLSPMSREEVAFAALADGDSDLAERLLGVAADEWATFFVRMELRARWGAGLIALRSGRRRAARESLLALERRATQLGFKSVAARTQRALRAVQASTPRGGSRTLSRQERVVLEFVGFGLPSAAISSQMGIRRSTVETHVRKAMAKLGARTRIEAALLATTQDVDSGRPRLEPRELELIVSIARGATITEAALRLGISRRTATRLLRAARIRAGVRNTAELAALYRERHPRTATRE